MKYGLIAEKLGHSFSPFIHGLLGNPDYALCEIKREELEDFFRRRDFCGINVTVPYKQAVIPYLDAIDPRAERIGAVNTVVNRGGRLYGYNTDADGLAALIRRTGARVRGAKALILGSGGTARTARETLRGLGAESAYFVRRDRKDGALTYADAYALHADASLIVNTTPCGMFPHGGEFPLDEDGKKFDLSAFPRLEGVIDVVYNPLRTALVLEAQERGLKAAGGLYMLVMQAIYADSLFRSTAFDGKKSEEVYAAVTAKKENVVLIGMPGSGKTTLGKLIAAEMNRPFIDSDAYIEEKAGKTIPEIFKEKGEAGFRLLESRAAAELALETGVVIATGGGCVLRRENVNALKMNGRLCLLDRAPEELTPTGGRPLADTAEKMRKLYAERLPVYRASADLTVGVKGTPEQTAKEITDLYRRTV